MAAWIAAAMAFLNFFFARATTLVVTAGGCRSNSSRTLSRNADIDKDAVRAALSEPVRFGKARIQLVGASVPLTKPDPKQLFRLLKYSE
jgi:hypothetical protein